MKIFVPVDGSEQSLRALDYLKIQSLLPWENPEVEVFYAILPVPGRIYAHETEEELHRYYEQEAARVFDDMKDVLAGSTVKPHYAYGVGEIVPTLNKAIEDYQPDLILIGSHGRGALRGFLFGSVSNSLLATTTRPMLIIRDVMPQDHNDIRVGLAVDGSEYSLAAAKFIIANRELFGPKATFVLANVVSDFRAIAMPSRAGVPLTVMSDEEVKAFQDEQFEKAVSPALVLFKEAGIPVETKRLCGEAGVEMAKFADSEELDLLVLGSHGYDNFEAAVLGSVATRIAAVSKSPLLIIRSTKA